MGTERATTFSQALRAHWRPEGCGSNSTIHWAKPRPAAQGGGGAQFSLRTSDPGKFAPFSDEHFSVDGTQVRLQAGASITRLRASLLRTLRANHRRLAATASPTSHGETHCNETHASTTEPETKRFTKDEAKEAKLSRIGNVMTENRNRFVAEAEFHNTLRRSGKAGAIRLLRSDVESRPT